MARGFPDPDHDPDPKLTVFFIYYSVFFIYYCKSYRQPKLKRDNPQQGYALYCLVETGIHINAAKADDLVKVYSGKQWFAGKAE